MERFYDNEGYVLGARMWKSSSSSELSGFMHAPDDHYIPPGRLLGVGYNLAWERGVQDALCAVHSYYNCGCEKCLPRLSQGHPAPRDNCGCGFWAVTTPKTLVTTSDQYAPPFLGVVRAWGKIVWHTEGFRAQHMMPVAIGATPGWSRGRGEAVKLADFYDCQYVDWSSLKDPFTYMRKEVK